MKKFPHGTRREGYKLPFCRSMQFPERFYSTLLDYGQNKMGRYASEEQKGEDMRQYFYLACFRSRSNRSNAL